VTTTSSIVVLGSASALAVAAFLALLAVGDRLTSVYWRRRERYLADVEQKLADVFAPTDPRAFARQHLLIIALFAIVGGLAGDVAGALLLGGLGVPLPLVLLRGREKSHRKQLERQLVGALTTMANALRATPTLAYAFDAVAQNGPAPIKHELTLVSQQLELGTSLEDALATLARRASSRRFDTVISALLVSRASGGDLPRVLDELAGFFRELERVEGVLEAQTAQGRMQALFLSVMPFVLSLVLFLVDPELILPLFTHPIGNMLLLMAVLMNVGGYMVVRRIVQPDL